MTVLTDTAVHQPSFRAATVASETLLQIEAVSRQYGPTAWGIRDVSLQLRPGILGLLGPNGAGKSTLMRILATLDRPRKTWVRLWPAASSPLPCLSSPPSVAAAAEWTSP